MVYCRATNYDAVRETKPLSSGLRDEGYKAATFASSVPVCGRIKSLAPTAFEALR